MKRVPMTPEGKVSLEKELAYLTGVLREKIIKDIEEARAHGDISENSEYEDAKERQAMCEGKIQDISAKLSLSQVIDVTSNPPKDPVVVFGATVTLVEYLEDDEQDLCYKIVGSDEVNIKEGKISYQSPIAQALIGKKEGDDVLLRVPKGTRELEIVGIAYI